eukprot:TRINITY_DN4859_c0_g1_i1.p1 TRINITY_DN4859_c0_g1~~TRINITY_DN4859_c0_g1_i1.p1  ORF type:complete len:358 (-),score=41.09 TRINITY_DN4859_c0_g1_i1:39-1088(-)
MASAAPVCACGTQFSSASAKFCFKCGAKGPGATVTVTPTFGNTTQSKLSAPSSTSTTPSSSSAAPTSAPAPTASPSATKLTPASPSRAPGVSPRGHEKRTDGIFCTGCSGIIVGAVVEVGQGKPGKYHQNCFVCSSCRNPITSSYTLDPDDKILCEPCANKQLNIESSNCGACGRAIEGHSVIATGAHYHPKCFACSKCHADLNVVPFLPSSSGLQCKNCVLSERGEICCTCNKLIDAGGVLAMDKRFHPACFNCATCKANLSQLGSFVAGVSGPICPNCAKQPGATKPASGSAPSTSASAPTSTSTSASAPTPTPSTPTKGRPKFCGECGSNLSSSGKFCAECGSKVP